MAKRNCPGQDTQYWKHDALFEEPCVHCGKSLEFFKDDLRRLCSQCGKYNVNPKNDLACAAWCASAAECLAQMGRRTSDEEEKDE